jgi:hypothetical protein
MVQPTGIPPNNPGPRSVNWSARRHGSFLQREVRIQLWIERSNELSDAVINLTIPFGVRSVDLQCINNVTSSFNNLSGGFLQITAKPLLCNARYPANCASIHLTSMIVPIIRLWRALAQAMLRLYCLRKGRALFRFRAKLLEVILMNSQTSDPPRPKLGICIRLSLYTVLMSS